MSLKPSEPFMSSSLQRWRAKTDAPLTALAIGSLPLLLVELKGDALTAFDRSFLNYVNVIVFAAFLVDYVVEFTLCSNRFAYVRIEWLSALVVATQAVALIPTLTGLAVLRIFRLSRFLRLAVVVVRGFAIGGTAARTGQNVLRERAGTFAISLAGFTWLSAAVGFTLAEDVGTTGRVKSFFDALWWSGSTITTVGYGDIFPVTFIGRLIGLVTMVVGVSVFAVITAKVAEFLVRGRNQREVPSTISTTLD
jgi:voltage-gated potassium channel